MAAEDGKAGAAGIDPRSAALGPEAGASPLPVGLQETLPSKSNVGRYVGIAALVAIVAGGTYIAGQLTSKSFRDNLADGSPCAFCPEMVVVPAGRFTMGSPASEPGRASNEGPQRQVTIARPFAVGKFEVTFAEWDACRAEGGCNHNPGDEGWGRGNRPVINVSWDDITKHYLPWLSRKTGKSYRLLSEAEWEYAARAGTTTPFWWGSSITPAQANYDGFREPYKGGGSKGEYRQRTVPVDSFAANAWGLYNVHGNVWEWVEDCWHDSYTGAPTDGSAWTTACTGGSVRVIRGGPWGDGPRNLRSALRSRSIPDYRGFSVGFRVARTL